ncbi:MAG: TonB-dependent receptor, partial [Caecibacter massiliensis]|nr:TonB-dependent receptor [Caecibacter massiliensis]
TAGYSKINRNLYFKNTYRNSDYVYGGFRYDIDKNQRLTVRASHLEEDGRYIGNISISKMLKEGKNYVPAYQTVTVGLDADGHKITEKRRDYLNGDRHLDSYNMTYESSLGSNWRFIGDFFYNK